MNARVKQQGGWAGSFVIIGIVLALLLLGGVYFLKSNEMGDMLATDTNSSSRDEATHDQEDQSTKSEDQAKQEDSASTKTQENTKDAEEKAADTAAKPHEETESDDAHTELPQTGPADTAASLTVFAILTYSVAAYIRSRGRLTL
ncbi:MAG TPA: hypothetical protein VGE13_03920 [Candidatus Saccharimonadales bacterium]